MSEIRYALRTLRKRPGPTLVVIVTLGVAIASVTLIYSAIDLVRNNLPIANRDGLVYVTSTDTRIIQRGIRRAQRGHAGAVVDSRPGRLVHAEYDVRCPGRILDGLGQPHRRGHPDARLGDSA